MVPHNKILNNSFKNANMKNFELVFKKNFGTICTILTQLNKKLY